MKNIAIMLLLISLSVQAQKEVGVLAENNKTIASLTKEKDFYVLRFLDYGNKKKVIEFDLQDYDKVYSAFSKVNSVGLKADEIVITLPITSENDVTGKLIICYQSKTDASKPKFIYMYGPEDMPWTIYVPDFTLQQWNVIFGK